ncbi:MAG: PAS domain-containing hybrid sensor histidine kinase/response regulator [Thermodesulfobacteriota bacterium]
MTAKPTYDALERRVKDLENEVMELKHIEEALRESGERLRMLLENAPFGITIMKPDWSFDYVNPKFTKIFGYTIDDIHDKQAWFEHAYPDAAYRDNMAAIWRNDLIEPPTVEGIKPRISTVRCKDGTDKIIHFQPVVIKNGWQFVIYEDITEQKKIEKAMRASEEKYRTILETIEEGYYETDIQGRFTFFNDPLCEMLGYPKNELAGKDNKMIMDEQNAKSVYKAFNAVYRTGTPVIALEHEIIRKNGDKLYVEVSASLRKDPRGKPIGFRGIIRNVSGRKEAEKEIEKREKYLESVLYNAPDAIITLDASHHVLEWNPGAEQIFGYTRDEAIGKNLDDLVACPDIADEARSYTQQVLSGKRLLPTETVRYRRDGTPVNVILAGSPILMDGKLQGIVAMYSDLTERRLAEEEKKTLEAQLQYAQKMEAIGTLAGGIAHNFNNLLMGIQGNTSLMLLETNPSHSNYPRLKNIEKAVENGSKLTSQLLGYAREGKYEVKLLNINRIVRKTTETFAAAKREIRVHEGLAEELWGVIADQGQLEQVILNLFVNAADAMPKGGDLFVRTEKATHHELTNKPYEVKPGNYVLLSIRDTGIGMDRKTVHRIFEPFFTTKGLSRGTGLGLSSVYGIIKSHGGYVDVQSKKNQGTTFKLYLPASGNTVLENQEPSSTSITGVKTVLLADDEEMILDVGAQILETLGFRVMLAKGGKETINIYNDNSDAIDVIILDMIMPDMGGSETFDKLKEINADAKVLLSSGYSIEGQAQEIMERGCDGFIQKPFRIDELSKKIGEIVQEKQT